MPLTTQQSLLSDAVFTWYKEQMISVMRKPAFCICENKVADQLHGNREADQRLCFRYMDSTIHLLPKSEISCLKTSSVAVQPGLCRTWFETPKTGFLTTRLKSLGLSSSHINGPSHEKTCLLGLRPGLT